MIGEVPLGAFSSHGDSARSNLVEHVESVDEPNYVELLDDDRRVLFTGPVSDGGLEVEGEAVQTLVQLFRRPLTGDES